MSYSNHTTNYNLPLYVGTDKPTYLGDFNSAMGTLDAQMKTNADSASSADSKATTANTNIGTMANLTTTDKATIVEAINEVDLHADTAQTTANNADTKATSALSKANYVEGALNLVAGTPITSGFTTVSGVTTSVTEGKITIAKNNDGSICKVYGYLNTAPASSTGATTIKLVTDSGLRPDEEFRVEGAVIVGSSAGVGSATLIFKTSGEIDVTFTKTGIGQDVRLLSVVIFVKSFGD